MKSQQEKADAFRALHGKGKVFVLPNSWDVPSARVFEDSGFPAVATSSAGVLVSLGYPDGEEIPPDEYVSAVRRMTKALSVPLSVDVVGGFGRDAAGAANMVRKVIEAGAVGINIEDFVHATKALVTVEEQVGKLKGLLRLQKETGVPFVINARTDALRYAPGGADEKMREAIRRAKEYRDVGVDCVYPMGLVNAEDIASFVKELAFPVNVMVRKGLPPVPELQKLGVARVSFGPSASYAAMTLLRRASKEVLEHGTYSSLVEDVITFDELNALASSKKE